MKLTWGRWNRRAFILAAVAAVWAGSAVASAEVIEFTSNALIAADDMQYDGQEIIVNGCTVTINGAHTFARLDVVNAGIVTHAPGFIAGDLRGCDLTIQTDVSIATGSRIDASGCGYGAGAGPGAGSTGGTTYGSGAGHGGVGGVNHAGTAGGAAYGDIATPTEFGSGGGRNTGGAGGGMLRLTVNGTLTVDGQLSVNGANGTSSGGGGSGGSLHLTVDTLAGSGTIAANGGAGASVSSGGGGGGRIAIYYATDNFSGTCTAQGGTNSRNGGAGTIYRKANDEPLGDLFILNGGLTDAARTPALAGDFFDEITIGQGARVDLSGSVIFSSHLLSVQDAGSVYLQMTATFDAVQVAAGGLITHFAGEPGFYLTVLGNLDIHSGGRVAADGCGYGADAGPGAGSTGGTSYGSGAGHGGVGGVNHAGTAGGAAYGDIATPTEFGSGGGRNTGGAGGGMLRLTVNGTLTVDGQLSVNGANGTSSGGGGSGGSLHLTVGTLAGSGTIAANGGAGASVSSGGGGGGRIAVYYTTDSFAGTCTAQGGTNGRIGGAGTVYRKANSEPLGDLFILNGGLTDAARTPALAGDFFDEITVGQGARVDLSGSTVFSSHLLSVQDAGIVYLQTAATFNAVQVAASGLITHFADEPGFDLTVLGNLDILPGGRVAADGCGHGADAGPGAGSTGGTSYGSGAGHGGVGGVNYAGTAGGAAYGDIATPTEFGSGGGRNTGGAGGGALRLTVNGTLTVDGQLSVNGANGTSYGGGGSGGSLHLTVGTLAGSGTIAANGGAGASVSSGGGGGGRIAVYYTTDSFAGTCTAQGGTNGRIGGAGTVYRKANSEPLGDLFILNGGLTDAARTPALAGDFFDEITIGQGARVDLSGSAIFGGHLLSVQDAGSVYLQTAATFDAIQVAAGGLITHFAGEPGFDLTVLGNLDILPGGRVAADGCGHAGGTGPGAGSIGGTTYGSGAGHGGVGGANYAGVSGGAAYGDAVTPTEFGSGGGRSGSGGAGGGMLRLTVNGTLTVDGQLSASGANGTSYGGGGSGGSLHLTVGTLTGSGTIAANGGAGAGYCGGGGGGRIAIYTCDQQMPPSAITTLGGSGANAGQPGTVFFGSNTVVVTQSPLSQDVIDLHSVTLTVAATGNGTLSYHWRKDGVLLEDDGRITGTHTDTLHVAPVEPNDTGHYDVLVTDDCGPFPSDAAYVHVLPCRGDSNCDRVISWRDIDFFVAAMNDNVAAWAALFGDTPRCRFENNDLNNDGTVSWRDIDALVAVMNTCCP